MRTIKYIPKVCTEHEAEDKNGKPILVKGKPQMIQPTFEGHIIMRSPSFDERYKSLEDMGMEAQANGEVKTVETNIFTMLRKMVAISRPFYQEVHLKKLSDGTKYESIEDMEADPDCDGILLEVAKTFREGFRPGKN